MPVEWSSTVTRSAATPAPRSRSGVSRPPSDCARHRPPRLGRQARRGRSPNRKTLFAARLSPMGCPAGRHNERGVTHDPARDTVAAMMAAAGVTAASVRPRRGAGKHRLRPDARSPQRRADLRAARAALPEVGAARGSLHLAPARPDETDFGFRPTPQHTFNALAGCRPRARVATGRRNHARLDKLQAAEEPAICSG